MHSPAFQSPVNQEFVWCADYADGTSLMEFDPITKQENLFISIRRADLIRFGLVGLGMKLYYEVQGGMFKVAGQRIELEYVDGDRVFPLTGQWKMYNNIVTYKSAQADLKAGGTTKKSHIYQYSFGYEETIVIDGVTFTIKAICHLPYQLPLHFTFGLTASDGMNGKLRIKKSGKVDEVDAEVEPGVWGEVNWTFTM